MDPHRFKSRNLSLLCMMLSWWLQEWQEPQQSKYYHVGQTITIEEEEKQNVSSQSENNKHEPGAMCTHGFSQNHPISK